MGLSEHAFVFVVCGAREHIDTLALSLQVLRQKTQYPIYVVTDTSRNETGIEHDRVIDIVTPQELSHHQASIWLKTSLYQHLPAGPIYAYLDTDVLAVGNKINNLFNEYQAPIRFAPDHCRMRQFSPYAMNCGCYEKNEKHRNVVNQLIARADPLYNTQDTFIKNERERLHQLFARHKRTRLHSAITALRFIFSRTRFFISPEFYYHKKEKIWYNKNNQAVMYHVSMKKIAKEAGLNYNRLLNDIQTDDRKSIWRDRCNHLAEGIYEKFGIQITEPDWQHWNGGVFLFSTESAELMDTWHQLTLAIFKDEKWKTRDQGTLIATVWKLGLQNHTTLDNQWNLILDYYNPHVEIFEDGKISLDGKHKKTPQLVHIYHHWGDTSWEVWKKIRVLISSHRHKN
jgi:hypothetical protein